MYRLLIVLILVIIYIYYKVIDDIYKSFINGVWSSDTIYGKVILYLDNDVIKLSTIDDDGNISKITNLRFNISSISYFNTYKRRYKFSIDSNNSNDSIVKILSSDDLMLDVYIDEGAIIICNDHEDLLTLIKDNNSNLSLMI